jgi:hypothetical protein
MLSRVLLTLLLVASVLRPAVLQAADGVLLVQSITSGTAPATSSQVQLEPTRIRTEMEVDGRRQVIVFDAAKGVLHIIDPARKSYIEMTKADADRMSGMMQGAMAMMQEQMAKMPPAQRAAMEQKMAGLLGGAAAGGAPPEYRRSGTDTVAKRTCDRYDVFTSGRKTSEICTVAPDALGLSVTDFAVLGKLSDFVRTLVPQMADRLLVIGTPTQGFSGLPVRTVTTMPDGTTVSVQLNEARRATFDDALFAVPAGFQKQSLLPSMGQ